MAFYYLSKPKYDQLVKQINQKIANSLSQDAVIAYIDENHISQ